MRIDLEEKTEATTNMLRDYGLSWDTSTYSIMGPERPQILLQSYEGNDQKRCTNQRVRREHKQYDLTNLDIKLLQWHV